MCETRSTYFWPWPPPFCSCSLYDMVWSTVTSTYSGKWLCGCSKGGRCWCLFLFYMLFDARINTVWQFGKVWWKPPSEFYIQQDITDTSCTCELDIRLRTENLKTDMFIMILQLCNSRHRWTTLSTVNFFQTLQPGLSSVWWINRTLAMYRHLSESSMRSASSSKASQHQLFPRDTMLHISLLLQLICFIFQLHNNVINPFTTIATGLSGAQNKS